MPTWIIEPRDPLIARDGRPFGPTPGARASTLAFPFPSTTTGGLRNRAGLADDGSFDRASIDRVKQIGVRGPLLVTLDHHGEIGGWLAPAPADALLIADDDGRPLRRQLAPLAAPAEARHNLPADLMLIGPRRYDPKKPLPAPPRFWHWGELARWLQAPADGPVALEDLGLRGPAEDRRTHVRINPEALTAEEGFLFQTIGLDFSEGARLALAVVADRALAYSGGLAPLGGERRLVTWRPSEQSPPPPPAELLTAIAETGHCRVVLLTPAHFAQGFRPAWLLEPRHGVTPTLKAALVPRPQVVSGWDFEVGRPRPTRRLAPAGSVFFLKLGGQAEAIKTWVTKLWLETISDSPQDRADGFGLAIVGTWSGQPFPLEVS